ncbi:Odorant receptor 110 [Blattella germanica]|nr:Odorant receptor 110 [Blattella germanica]
MAELLRLQKTIFTYTCCIGSNSKWHFYLAIGCWLILFMGQVYGIRSFWGNVDAIAEIVGVAVLCTFLFIQAFHCLRHKDQLQHIIDSLENLFKQFENEECRQIVMNTNQFNNKMIKILVPIFVTDVTLWVIIPFIRYYFDEDKHERKRDDNEPFPYFSYIVDFPFDATHSPIYEFVFLVQFTMTSIMSLYNIAFLTIVISTILFTASYFKALAAMLRKLSDFEPGDKEIEDPEAYLNNCIRFHQQLLSLMSDLQDYIGPILVFFVKPYEVFLCISVYEAALMTEKVSAFIEGALGMLFCIAIFCSFGEHLKKQSELLEAEVTACRWYVQSTRFKRSHMILLAQCQRTVCLQVGLFYPLTLETFIKILNSTYAYFNLLQQLQ